MLNAFLNIFRIPDLRKKVLFTLAMLAVYRIGFFVPIAGIDQQRLVEAAQTAQEEQTALGRFIGYTAIFTGGDFGQSTIFGLGIMPYITAAIIFQLFQTTLPALQRLKKEGATGQQKIQEWTRYATVGLCVIQAFMWVRYLHAGGLIQQEMTYTNSSIWLVYIAGITSLTAGSMFLMWLGEQIDKYGIGNGVSLILTAGIIAQMPQAVLWVVQSFDPAQAASEGKIGLLEVVFLILAFVGVVAGAVLITIATRRIPIQQAKHTRGRKQVGGQRHYLPLRVNHAGVMPIIFASSLMIIPSVIFSMLATRAGDNTAGWAWWRATTSFLAEAFQMGMFPYIFFEIILIFIFSYLWTTVQFSAEDMAKQLKDNGSFIPGLRPGPRTAEYLETVMERITYVGAGFLAVIAIIPEIVTAQLGIPFYVSSFLGGTGLLIVVAVGLDLMQRVEANLLMRNYQGFLGSGSRVKGRRG
ncbi:MAG: preprotein translocase subunit SecY [Phycisphaerales bacterium]